MQPIPFHYDGHCIGKKSKICELSIRICVRRSIFLKSPCLILSNSSNRTKPNYSQATISNKVTSPWINELLDQLDKDFEKKKFTQVSVGRRHIF